MSDNETLAQRIMRHEGFCLKPKPDAKGMWVIGYGHDLTENDAQSYCNGISDDEAKTLLESDIANAKYHVSEKLPWSSNLSETRQEILQEMCFQLGINGLLEFRNMLLCAQDNDPNGVVANMLSSKWHQETAARCEELSDLWLRDGNGNTAVEGESSTS